MISGVKRVEGGVMYRGEKFPGFNKPKNAPAGDKHKKVVLAKKGDKVKQGQVIGYVGNSGNCDAPHLHFQLMDAPSHLTGKGLPCSFTNITDCFGNKIERIDLSRSIIHTK